MVSHWVYKPHLTEGFMPWLDGQNKTVLTIFQESFLSWCSALAIIFVKDILLAYYSLYVFPPCATISMSAYCAFSFTVFSLCFVLLCFFSLLLLVVVFLCNYMPVGFPWDRKWICCVCGNIEGTGISWLMKVSNRLYL